MSFWSIEPLLEDLGRVRLEGMDWVIVGGESGPGARPLGRDWVVSLRDQCQRARVPFFFKQWGGVRKVRNGRELDGRTYDEYPERALVDVPLKSECMELVARVGREVRGLRLAGGLVSIGAGV